MLLKVQYFFTSSRCSNFTTQNWLHIFKLFCHICWPGSSLSNNRMFILVGFLWSNYVRSQLVDNISSLLRFPWSFHYLPFSLHSFWHWNQIDIVSWMQILIMSAKCFMLPKFLFGSPSFFEHSAKKGVRNIFGENCIGY